MIFTVTQVNYKAVDNLLRAATFSQISDLRPSTEGNASSAAIFEVNDGASIQTWVVSDSFTTVHAGLVAEEAANGAEILTNKDASGGYAGLTLFKINFKNALNTFTSFFTNANTAARTYTFQDRDGTIADNTDLTLKLDVAKIATKSFTLSSGESTQALSSLTASSAVIVQRVSRGGTFAPNGYNVVITPTVGYVVSALDSSDVVETGCTDTLMALIKV